MAPNLLIYICISELTKQRDNARLRTLVERNQVMQQRRAFGFNSDDAGDDFDDYASNGSSDFPSSGHENEKVEEEVQLSSEEEELDSASTGTQLPRQRKYRQPGTQAAQAKATSYPSSASTCNQLRRQRNHRQTDFVS